MLKSWRLLCTAGRSLSYLPQTQLNSIVKVN